MSNKYAVIMAGGVGSRFWPVSTQSYPKQFHDMLGIGRSLLQMTYDRLITQIPSSNILILTSFEYIDLVQTQLPDVVKTNIVAEPAMRNTAPSILLAALKIKKINPNAVMIVAPSDHYIGDSNTFNQDLDTVFTFCSQHPSALMTLGVQPTAPNTGYGYIEYDQSSDAVKSVIQFREKPDQSTAQQFIDQGNFLWNAGIFIWSVEAVVNAFAKAQPIMTQLFNTGWDYYNTEREQQFLNIEYHNAQNISIDYAIMENADNVYVLPAQFTWNDLGTWGSLYNQLPGDSDRNVVVNAQLMADHATGNIISTATDKKVIVKGLDDYIIVDNDDVLMIIPKHDEQLIKQIRNNAIETFGKHMG